MTDYMKNQGLVDGITGARNAQRSLQERIKKLEVLLMEAQEVCDDLINKTDVYLGINDAYSRHEEWEKEVKAALEDK